MSAEAEAERAARAALTWVAEPGDPVMGALLRYCSPAEIVAALTEGRMPRTAWVPSDSAVPETADIPRGGGPPEGSQAEGSPPEGSLPEGSAPGGGTGTLWEGGEPAGMPRLARALSRWAARLGEVPPESGLAALRRDGIRLVIPGDAEWPSQLGVLGEARPWGLWVRGQADLRYACLRSVSVVGTRAATGYGTHVCGEMAISLAEAGWTVVSGGAFGIDGCAHRGAMAVDGTTVAVLACGVDRAYPQAHEGLFGSIRERGATWLVSGRLAGCRPGPGSWSATG